MAETSAANPIEPNHTAVSATNQGHSVDEGVEPESNAAEPKDNPVTSGIDEPRNEPVTERGTEPASGTDVEPLSESVTAAPAEQSATEPPTADLVTNPPTEPHITESVAAPVTPLGDTPTPMVLDQVTSFDDFLRYLVGLDAEFKPTELAKNSSARAALTKQVDLDEFGDRIADVATRDAKLATSLALMLTAEKSDLRGNARRNMTALSARLIGSHPAFGPDPIFADRLARLVAGEVCDDLLPMSIARTHNLVSADFDGKAALKATAVQSLSDNAAHTLVLIAASAANWDLADCVDSFADNIWGAIEADVHSDSAREKLVVLPKGARKAAALVVGALRGRLRSAETGRDEAIVGLEAARAEVKRSSAELATTRARTTALEDELVQVRAELQRESDSRRSERMGATSDFETMRIDTAQVISRQIESLEDALDALEHGQPAVTDEFVKRVANNLRRSLTTLQPPSMKDSQGDSE